MKHDPLCPIAPGKCLAPGPHQPNDNNRYCWKCCDWCQCELIAEAKQCGRLEEAMYWREERKEVARQGGMEITSVHLLECGHRFATDPCICVWLRLAYDRGYNEARKD